MKSFKTFLFLLMLVVLSGCDSKNLPAPYSFVHEKLNYDKVVNIKIDNKHNTKIFIDNRFDQQRRTSVIKSLVNRLSNQEVSLIYKSKIVNKDENFDYINREQIKLKTPYSYDLGSLFFTNSKDIFIKNDDIKIVNDGIIVENLKDKTLIVSLYNNINWLRDVYGINIKFKLDTDALEKGIAHFTDEYLKKYSLKEALEKELRNQGYVIVDDIKKADIVISSENLGYSMIKHLINKINYPKNYNLSYQYFLEDINKLESSSQEIKILSFDSIGDYFYDSLTKNYKPFNPTVSNNSAGKAVLVLAMFNALDFDTGPLSTINSIKVFKNQQEIGRIIDLSISRENLSKDVYDSVRKYTYKYNEVLSDELIDELNSQAAKQVLEKIHFVEK